MGPECDGVASRLQRLSMRAYVNFEQIVRRISRVQCGSSLWISSPERDIRPAYQWLAGNRPGRCQCFEAQNHSD
jgi:hypothetical protein